jgi:hypothetical protein
VDNVTTAGVKGRGVVHGLMWSIPKTMFEALGGCLTGSLAVSLFVVMRQEFQTIQSSLPTKRPIADPLAAAPSN